MRFMMLVIPGGYEDAAPGTTPDAEGVERMMAYNEQLQKAGVLLALDGLHPPSMGFRVSYSGGKATVKDGPFAEAKEVVGGYWMIDVASREEAVEWARKAPMGDNEIIEVRQVQEFEDFPEDVQEKVGDFELGDPETRSRGRGASS
ncbi:YciI family protein [soil metagenome]